VPPSAALLSIALAAVLVPVTDEATAAVRVRALFAQVQPGIEVCWQLPDPSHLSVVQMLPSSVQEVPEETNPSVGQAAVAPVQFSAISHSLAAARQL
jgi:hypothetical protein